MYLCFYRVVISGYTLLYSDFSHVVLHHKLRITGLHYYHLNGCLIFHETGVIYFYFTPCLENSPVSSFFTIINKHLPLTGSFFVLLTLDHLLRIKC